MIGSVFSHYRVLEELGRGGMGVVYKAQDTQLDRLVALKFLPPDLTRDHEAKQRFVNEARAASALDHPNICTVFEIGETEDGQLFLAMAYYEGETLREKVGRGQMQVDDCLAYSIQIAQGLQAAHEKGIVHRDIKSSNILVTNGGQVKIMDFGLAKTVTMATMTKAGTTLGTVPYMSPEQARGETVDHRTDIWSLGVVMYEMIAGRLPFEGAYNEAVLYSILNQMPQPLGSLRSGVPAALELIVRKALQKKRDERYPSAARLAQELSDLRAGGAPVIGAQYFLTFVRRPVVVVPSVLFFIGIGVLTYWWIGRNKELTWARERAIPEIEKLRSEQKNIAAFVLLREAEQYSPDDSALTDEDRRETRVVSILSSPPGATVEIKDYISPNDPWFRLGTTPLSNVRIPNGYFRWRISKEGVGEYIAAPVTDEKMNFPLGAAAIAPEGMVPVEGGTYYDYLAFVGWEGPYNLPSFFIDRFEVTNRQYQIFVNQGGYQNQKYWKEPFERNGQALGWRQAMELFRDSTGRPGPSTWEAGHYPEGQADYPVSGVSWFEAVAFAEFAEKSLPVISQWYMMDPPDLDKFILPMSNFSPRLAPVGQFKGLGPYGTYDIAGNVREWCRNAVGRDLRLILGRFPGSYGPEALSPFDRSPINGFRCVRNAGPLSSKITGPRTLLHRDFAHAIPASDKIFEVYRSMYAYEKLPLNAKLESTTEEGDWKKEEITIDAAYGSQRLPLYLFIPKDAKPPYQTIVFYPSARILFSPSSKSLGDMSFVDFVIKSGRAVLYPIYQGTYERLEDAERPGGSAISTPSGSREILIDRSKDLGRAIDYIESRPDLDRTKIAYLGVSMGAADGVILSALEDRLKVVIFLDGGFYQEKRLPGTDQIDFAPRLKKPVLMINGRYDITFPLERSQMPLFRMLGTVNADKKHVVFETAHDVRSQRTELVREVLTWANTYLGKVE